MLARGDYWAASDWVRSRSGYGHPYIQVIAEHLSRYVRNKQFFDLPQDYYLQAIRLVKYMADTPQKRVALEALSEWKKHTTYDSRRSYSLTPPSIVGNINTHVSL